MSIKLEASIKIQSKPLLIVLDTSAFIVFCLATRHDFAKKIWKDFKAGNRIKLCLSKDVLDEIKEVIKYPEIKNKLDFSKISRLMADIVYSANFYEIKDKIIFERDPKDAKILELVLASKADYLISMDKDLLDLKIYNETKIIDFEEFKKLI
jgi:putative PIN family toxin of toxin-antitoxin system